MLDHLGLATPIWPVPVEIPDAIPFTDRPFLVRTQTYAASDVPDEPAGI